jgi:hypothetical protein
MAVAGVGVAAVAAEMMSCVASAELQRHLLAAGAAQLSANREPLSTAA